MRERMEERKGSFSIGFVMLCFYIWIKSIGMRGLHKEPKAMDTPPHAMDLLPIEIIEEIMIRLPVKSVMRFRCVSKYWNNFISDDRFRRRYRSRQLSNGNTPFGFICGNNNELFYETKHDYCVANKFLYTSRNYVEKEELESFKYLKRFGYVIVASNGLLLLGHNPKALCAYDIVSKKYVSLLSNNLETFDDVSLGFKCEENNNANNHLCSYKVVCVDVSSEHAYGKKGIMYNVETYSSETGTCQKSIIKSNYHFKMRSQSVSKVIGGLFYWHQYYSDRLVAYDSDNPTGDVVLIELPWLRDLYLDGKILRHFEVTKDGSLQFIGVEDMALHVWIMRSKNGQSYMDQDINSFYGWNLVSTVKLWDIAGCVIGDITRLQGKLSRIICTDPVDPNIIYVDIKNQLYAYNYREGKSVFKFCQKITWEANVFVYFEWPAWPCL